MLNSTLVRYFGLDNDNHEWYFLGSFFDEEDMFSSIDIDRYCIVLDIYKLELMLWKAHDLMELTSRVEDTY